MWTEEVSYILKKELLDIINKAKNFGLPEKDISNAIEFLKYGEFGLCLETVVVQLFEYDIKIDEDFFEMVAYAASKMKLTEKDYLFLKQLIITGW